MKILISTAAMVILWTMFSAYQIDMNQYTRELEHLKYVADECSASAALYYDNIQFSEGMKAYNQAEGNKAILSILKRNLYLYDNLTPKKRFFSETVKYYTYYFDDSGYLTSYSNGGLQNKTSFTFPYLFTEPLTGYKKLITEPIVIITVDEGKPKFRLLFLNINNTIRTSAYEYLEDR